MLWLRCGTRIQEGRGMKVLVVCEFSGGVRDAFRARCHDAYSCDLLGSPSTHHIEGDAIESIQLGEWDIVVAHPP